MPELLPHGDAQMARGDRFSVGDENGLAGGALRVQQVGDGEYVCVGGIVHVHVVLQVGAGAEDEGGLAAPDAGVDRGDAGGVVGAEDGGRAESAGGEVGGICGEDEGFGFGLGWCQGLMWEW